MGLRAGARPLPTARRDGDGAARALPVRVPLAGDPAELGVGPFDQNYFTVTVDDASGMITEVNSSWRGADDLMREVGDPFTVWVTTTYPDDVAVMTANGQPALTPESLALWDAHWRGYVQHVLGTTPTHDCCVM